jgi:MYXO-CTERM domain-containing protein
MRRIGCFLSLSVLGMTPLLAGCGPEASERTSEGILALSQSFEKETEPNAGPGQATVIGNDTVVRANVFLTGDNDFYRVTANAGDRVFAATMTGFSAAANNSQLAVVGLDGIDCALENDLNNGVFTTASSSIAGVPLAQQGNYYLRVSHSGNSAQIRPYDLHVKVQNGMPTAEMEPNDGTAQMLPAGGYVSGATSGAADVDSYAIMLQAGDTVFASLDLDPERDTSEWNGQLSLTSMMQPALVVNDSDTSTTPDSEALMATVQTAGMYEIRVGSTNGSGTYLLSVSVHPGTDATPNCTTYTSADIPKTIGPMDNQPASSTITIPGNPRIADIDVSIQLNHMKADDLDVHLISPAGNTNALFTDIGGNSAITMNMTIDDEGAFPISSVGVPFTGFVMQPENNYRLHWFDGENAGGTWTLVINDDTNNNGGNLTGWSIRVCEPPPTPVTCGVGIPLTKFSSDFEVDAGGFTSNGAQNEWQRGTPNFAPITDCNSGTQCWKTDLLNTYNSTSSQNLVSPAISLADVKAPIALSWAMKYQMENATNDRAWVEIREVGGANPQRVWQFLDDTMQTQIQVAGANVNLTESAGWGVTTADVSAFAGKNVEVVFHLESSANTNFAGLAIDDVSVIGCPSAVCGNAMVEGTEQCDDGNMANGDNCDNNCTMTACGNGIMTITEMCDDGNLTDGDGCDSNCTMTACGNGIATGTEDCDDGNMVDGDNCDSNCTVTGCGNGIITMPEVCDDANGTDGDDCDSNCTLTACGNGIPTSGEACDDGNMAEGDGCDSNCTVSACGNGIIGAPEICDDGNAIDGDGCDSDCTITGCGNGVQTMNELCEDGNLDDGDGCDSNCTPTGCANGVPTVGEGCDDGNAAAGDGCNDLCGVEMGYECSGTPSICALTCGNGALQTPENCDDGNTNAGDGCTDTCVVENGYECTGEPSTCNTVCGDNIIAGTEDCDDGNTKSDDGCSDKCASEGVGGSGGNGGNATGGATGEGGRGGASTQPPGEDGSCACSVPGKHSAPNPSFWAGLVAALGMLRRRQNRRRSSV